MVTVGVDLARVLASSEERLRISRDLRDQSRESIRRTQQAILHSHEVMDRSDRVIQDMGRNQSADEEKPAVIAIGGPTNLMEVVSGQTISNQVLNMDGKHFIDCEISNCVLEYTGQALVMESTHFSECSFRFNGEAALTLRFLECFGLLTRQESAYALHPFPKTTSQRPN